MLKGKTVILGVTGSIAAYKIANLASMLTKLHCDVHVLMTQNATNFIHPITFETLTNNKCIVDTFDRNFQYNVEHVSLAKRADVVLIAPATANVIAKLAYGLADDMLTTTTLACTCKKIVAPAMNTNMYRNAITQDNLKRLTQFDFEVDEQTLLNYILKEIAMEKDMKGVNVLVTAGATQEAIDPVRYITNHSTGKMGYALARDCMLRGANVTLVSGQSALTPPPFTTVISVTSAKEMFDAVTEHAESQDIIIKAAAVADYRPASIAAEKMKKKEDALTIELERTDDILKYLGEHKHQQQFLCGFSMETEHMLENSRKKLEKKHLDMIVANNLKQAGAGFGTDTNVVTMITPQEEIALELMSKEEAAHAIVSQILKNRS